VSATHLSQEARGPNVPQIWPDNLELAVMRPDLNTAIRSCPSVIQRIERIRGVVRFMRCINWHWY